MINIREMKLADYDSVITLMKQTQGVTVRDADSYEATARYLERNPGLSFVAEQTGTIVGCVMCGHDGRRGYLQHLIVGPEQRGKGIAQKMVLLCIEHLESLGIVKTHIDVLITNQTAIQYWVNRGWKKRDDIVRFSFIKSKNNNA
ncbi:MAG: GNAT family N-acetyltransferase [Pseudomonadota bacterium]